MNSSGDCMLSSGHVHQSRVGATVISPSRARCIAGTPKTLGKLDRRRPGLFAGSIAVGIADIEPRALLRIRRRPQQKSTAAKATTTRPSQQYLPTASNPSATAHHGPLGNGSPSPIGVRANSRPTGTILRNARRHIAKPKLPGWLRADRNRDAKQNGCAAYGAANA